MLFSKWDGEGAPSDSLFVLRNRENKWHLSNENSEMLEAMRSELQSETQLREEEANNPTVSFFRHTL